MTNLFPVIRAAFGVASPPAALTAEECRELVAFGKKQSILPVIYAGMKKMDIPEDLLKSVDAARNSDLRQFLLNKYSLSKIESALNEEQIPYLPLKGAVLRNLYPSPEMRTSCDIDVLVKEEDLASAIAAIENKTDFTMQKRNYHDVSMLNRFIHLELHFSIKENMDNIDKLLARVWEHAVPADGYRYVLTPEYQIFHVVAHMCYHMGHGGIGIRPFLDLWLLRNKTSYDEETVRRMCADCGILTFYEKCCALVDSWMAGRTVPEDLVQFEGYVLAGGVYGKKEDALASEQRKNRGFSYFFHRVFISRNLLEEEFPILKKKPYLLAIYQVRRWAKLLNREKRAQVRNEIERVNAMDPQVIDSLDSFLSSLGL